MPDKPLGIPERAALLTLMAEARELSNPELKRLVGVDITGQRRHELGRRHLITTRRVGRAFAHELTDKGWNWCADELAGSPPSGAGSGGRALYAVLAGLDRYLERTNRKLADVFLPATVGPVEPEPPAGPDAEVRVRTAYRRLARRHGDWVSLTDLRALLPDLDRSEVDAALRRMSRTPLVNIVPAANQKVLTPEDRAAAVRIGMADCHLIAIEAS
jgi:hypothetical protein